ncbi:retrovirus-related Pol polyprotein from transposon 17.6 [Trichonephila clavipes]|nr:retrovirus-related Pol polyprotein from transposon 17.6 [Trichonephila clavipes]
MMQREIVLHAHAQGHFASKKTESIVSQEFYIPRLTKIVQDIYPVKSTSTKDDLVKLILQQTIFGNPSKIITDKGSAFTSTEFQKFCQEESIEHIQITTGVPRGNGQIELPPHVAQNLPFEVLIGVKMKQKEDLQIKHLLEDELSEQFINKRETLRNEAKENILRLQDENKKQYNKHRKPAYNYKPCDTVAIQRTQFGTGLKLRPKYFGPYEVTSQQTRSL